MANIMDKVLWHKQTGTSMLETLLMDLKKIYQQTISGKMARFTQENGKKAYKMEKENYKKSKAKSLYWLTKVTGSME